MRRWIDKSSCAHHLGASAGGQCFKDWNKKRNEHQRNLEIYKLASDDDHALVCPVTVCELISHLRSICTLSSWDLRRLSKKLNCVIVHYLADSSSSSSSCCICRLGVQLFLYHPPFSGGDPYAWSQCGLQMCDRGAIRGRLQCWRVPISCGED